MRWVLKMMESRRQRERRIRKESKIGHFPDHGSNQECLNEKMIEKQIDNEEKGKTILWLTRYHDLEN